MSNTYRIEDVQKRSKKENILETRKIYSLVTRERKKN